MITGFNTDVEYDGRVFHVQTEDKGRENPVVESLVYTGGEIVDSVRTNYKDPGESGDCPEQVILARMEVQHQALIRDIRNGKYDPEGPKPFGYNLISNRSLDEVVEEFLATKLSVERIQLEMVEHQPFNEGTTPTLRFRVREETTERPVAGARVVVKLISTRSKPTSLFSGATDQNGEVTASFDIPKLKDAETAVVCQAEAAGANSEFKQLVMKAGD